jgi:hypothetical protein
VSAGSVAQGAADVLAAAVAGVDPPPLVLLGIPLSFNAATVLYLYHDGSTDARVATGGLVRRTHVVPIHLMMLAGQGDEPVIEANCMAIHDVLCNAFYAHHTLNGACQSAELFQRDGDQGSGAQYVEHEGATWRHRWWTLRASEDLTLMMA